MTVQSIKDDIKRTQEIHSENKQDNYRNMLTCNSEFINIFESLFGDVCTIDIDQALHEYRKELNNK